MPATPPPDQQRLQDALITPNSLWHHVQVVAESPSTNADLAAAARLGTVAPGTVLITDNQTAGRGRFTRSWTAPPGVSTAMSIAVLPTRPAADWGWLSLLSGVAVADGIRDSSGLPAMVKWPNDVLIAERKVSGMIAERVETPAGPAAIIGIGINVSMDADELPVPTATSLLLQGATVDKSELLIAVLRRFEEIYLRWEQDPATVLPDYADACATLGRRVRVLRSQIDAVEGIAVGIDHNGSLLVRVGEETESFAAGDVLHLR